MPSLQQSQQAARLLLQRRELRRSLAAWARLCGFEPARHHLFVIERLEQVVAGKIKKLMLFLPPGSAKSTYASVLFPPWFLCQRPNSSILVCSHSGELAESFGRRARNLIETYSKQLGFSLTADSKAAGRWETSNGGLFFCAGVGAGIAGHRADLGLIDDPIGKKEDADSQLVRDKQWDWFNFDFRPRLRPGAATVLIQTRWHEDDLAGRLLEREGNEWEVVSLPLVAQENDPLGRAVGELLWPEWFNEKTLEEARKDERAFNALYQGQPTPETGEFFKREWLKTYKPNELPKQLRIYVASDHAVSTRESADYTCLLPFGVDVADNVWILPDVFWARCDTEAAVNAMLDLARRLAPITWWAEKGHITKAIGPFLRKRMAEERVFFTLEELTPATDKRSRAQSIRGRMANGKVLFPGFAPWWPRAMHELLSFDAGKHDDFVDALAYAGIALQRLVAPAPRVELFRPQPLTLGWIKRYDQYVRRQQEYARYRDN